MNGISRRCESNRSVAALTLAVTWQNVGRSNQDLQFRCSVAGDDYGPPLLTMTDDRPALFDTMAFKLHHFRVKECWSHIRWQMRIPHFLRFKTFIILTTRFGSTRDETTRLSTPYVRSILWRNVTSHPSYALRVYTLYRQKNAFLFHFTFQSSLSILSHHFSFSVITFHSQSSFFTRFQWNRDFSTNCLESVYCGYFLALRTMPGTTYRCK